MTRSRVIGGPIHGKWHLADANIDWGQDLFELKEWLEERPEVKPISVEYYGFPSREFLGIEAGAIPPVAGSKATSLSHGWYAVSVNLLVGYGEADYDEPRFTYFQNFEPVATIGYSIYVYRVGESEVRKSKFD